MKLEITHQTSYRYSRKVGLLPHWLMLSPRNDRYVRTLAFDLNCTPSASIDWSQDVFGNSVATVSFSQDASELVITSRATVEQTADQWPIFNINPTAHSYPFGYSSDDITDLGSFTKLGSVNDAVGKWAATFIYSRPTDTLSLLKDINSGILTKVS